MYIWIERDKKVYIRIERDKENVQFDRIDRKRHRKYVFRYKETQKMYIWIKREKSHIWLKRDIENVALDNKRHRKCILR